MCCRREVFLYATQHARNATHTREITRHGAWVRLITEVRDAVIRMVEMVLHSTLARTQRALEDTFGQVTLVVGLTVSEREDALLTTE